MINRSCLSAVLFLFLATSVFGQVSSNSGRVKIDFNLEYLYVLVDENPETLFYIMPGDSFQIGAGQHTLRLVNEVMDDQLGSVNVEKGKTAYKFFNFSEFSRQAVSSYNILAPEENIYIETEPEGSIYVNDTYRGMGSASLLLGPQKQHIRIDHPEYGSLTFSHTPSLFETVNIGRFNNDTRKNVRFLKLIPAAEFISNGEKKKATQTIGGFVLLGGALVYNELKFKQKRDTYATLEQDYVSETATLRSIEAGRKLIDLTSQMDRLNVQRNFIFAGLAAWYGLTTYWAFKRPEGGYKRAPVRVQPQFALTKESPVLLTVSVNLGGQ